MKAGFAEIDSISLGDFKIGIQLYGLQDECKQDFKGTLKILAGFGYQGIELLPFCESVAEPLGEILRALNLQFINYYSFDPERYLNPDHAIYSYLRKLDIRHVTVGFPGHVQKDWAQAIEKVRRLAEVFGRQGLMLDYHNHTEELQKVQGRPALELLAEQTDPGLVHFELDTFMTAKAGEDPCRWIERFAGRITRLHLKDIHQRDGSVAVFGAGDLNAHAVLEAAARSGVEWLVVEFHPQKERPPLELAQLCLEGLRRAL